MYGCYGSYVRVCMCLHVGVSAWVCVIVCAHVYTCEKCVLNA